MVWILIFMMLSLSVKAFEHVCTFTASNGDYYDLSPLSDCRCAPIKPQLTDPLLHHDYTPFLQQIYITKRFICISYISFSASYTSDHHYSHLPCSNIGLTVGVWQINICNSITACSDPIDSMICHMGFGINSGNVNNYNFTDLLGIYFFFLSIPNVSYLSCKRRQEGCCVANRSR